MEDKKFVESNSYTDMKILLGFISCVLGVLSHFYFVPFPQSKYALIGCVIGYSICASLYYYIDNYLQKDAFFISKSHSVRSRVG